MPLVTIDFRMHKSSGIGTYLVNLVPMVIASMPEVEFCILGNQDDTATYNWCNAANISCVDVKSPIYTVAEQVELLRAIPKNVDLFWSPHYNIPVLYSGRLLVTVHDVFHLALPKLLGGLHKQLYAKIMFAAVKRKADAVITVSEFTSRELISFTGICKDRVVVTHEGVDTSWHSIVEGVSPKEKPYLLFVGNIKPHKNLCRLLDAFQLLLDKIPHNLIIVGQKEGFITQDREVISKAEKLRSRVHFTGHVTFTELRQYYAHADAFVFPSLYEGFGFPPLEAMACGCPVVVSETASMPEICQDAAIYCNPYSSEDIAQKIMTLLVDHDLRRDLVIKGKKRVNNFSWEKCAASTSEVIRGFVTA